MTRTARGPDHPPASFTIPAGAIAYLDIVAGNTSAVSTWRVTITGIAVL